MRLSSAVFVALVAAGVAGCEPAPPPPGPTIPVRNAPPEKPSVADLERILDRGTPDRRAAAARALGELGPAAGAAVPFLVESLRDEDPAVVDAVRRALPVLGPAPKSSLVRLRCALKDHAAAVRTGAAEVLAGLGPDALDAVPELIDALGDPDCGVRLASVYALVRVGARAVPPLLEALVDAPPRIGRGVVDALRYIVPEGKDALMSIGEPVLREILATDR